MGSIEHYLVNTSTLVSYQGKLVSFTLSRISQGTTFDHVSSVYSSTSDNESRLKP